MINDSLNLYRFHGGIEVGVILSWGDFKWGGGERMSIAVCYEYNSRGTEARIGYSSFPPPMQNPHIIYIVRMDFPAAYNEVRRSSIYVHIYLTKSS